MTCHQTIVWIDAEKACILRMQSDLERESTIYAKNDAKPADAAFDNEDAPSGSPSEVARYFYRVARALDIADEILVAGPSGTKLDFVKYMHKNEHALDPRILGVETVARPSDVALAAFAKLYFTEGGPRRLGNERPNRIPD